MKGLHTLTQESERRMYKVRVGRRDSKGADITPKQRQAGMARKKYVCLLAVGLLALSLSVCLARSLALCVSVSPSWRPNAACEHSNDFELGLEDSSPSLSFPSFLPFPFPLPSLSYAGSCSLAPFLPPFPPLSLSCFIIMMPIFQDE